MRVEILKAALAALQSKKKPFTPYQVGKAYQKIASMTGDEDGRAKGPFVVFVQGDPGSGPAPGEPREAAR